MKWANILNETKGNESIQAVCQIGERLYRFENTTDELLAQGAFNAQDETALRSLGGTPIEDNWENLTFHKPLTLPGKILCVGLNYTDHAQEVGAPLPEYPTIFTKYSNALIGPNEDIQLPPESTKIDWEAELCVVIGNRARRISVEEADDAIWGYTVMNDISVRDWQGRTSEWFQGKNWDKTTPFGPVIVTTDEIDPAEGLSITCSVDGETRQSGTTANMIFSAAQVVSYISTFMTLEPGDLITLGTPAGVGLSLHPRKWLSDGQTVLTAIEGIGELENTCRAEK